MISCGDMITEFKGCSSSLFMDEGDVAQVPGKNVRGTPIQFSFLKKVVAKLLWGRSIKLSSERNWLTSKPTSKTEERNIMGGGGGGGVCPFCAAPDVWNTMYC